MNRAGALELLMPGVSPAELWVESGRWDQFGPELLRLKDRHERDFCLGPTHEEVITDIARRELKSYRQLPVNFYQIQTKFRDELRPRFGVMRAREFLMKDAYSFHLDQASLRAGLPTRCTRPTPRIFDAPAAQVPRGGRRHRRHRRQRLAGIPRARRFRRRRHRLLRRRRVRRQPRDGRGAAARRRRAPRRGAALAEVATPGARTIDEADRAAQAYRPISCVKTLLVDGAEGGVVALLVRGDHELNAVKAQKLPGVLAPLRMASTERDRARPPACEPGFLGPVGFKGKVYADHAAAALADFVCGANKKRRAPHRRQLGPRSARSPRSPTCATSSPGDPSPTGKGTLSIARGIEVGHIFQLGTQVQRGHGRHRARRSRASGHDATWAATASV